VLGNDAPLYTKPQPEPDPSHIAQELNLPVPIRRRAFEERVQVDGATVRTQASAAYYGPGKSLTIWAPDWPKRGATGPVPREAIVPADLSDWQYRPPRGQMAVDPVLGRIVFHPRELPLRGVHVSYHYGFPADLGGGEYHRDLVQPSQTTLYRVGPGEAFARISEALARWHADLKQAGARPPETLRNAVIEIADSGVYVEQIYAKLPEGTRLQLRAAVGARPIIRLLDWHTDLPDDLSVELAPGSRFTLDGLLVTGRGMQVRDKQPEENDQPYSKRSPRAAGDDTPGRCLSSSVTIRHSTLVPGWTLYSDCEPKRPAEPSLELIDTQASVTIEHSIVGSIQVNLDEVGADPIPIAIRDSILDATGSDCDDPRCEAVGAPGWPLAHAVLTIQRSTVLGHIYCHAIDLAENSIFMGMVKVGRRQRGCMRFCSIKPGSRTPRRYNCQPDLVEKPIRAQFSQNEISEDERDRALAREQLRVLPQFNSVRYGTPTYCQLAATCAEEIKRGAEDESEMGVYHDLYQPQREANLRARLDEYTPASMDAGVIFAS